MDLLTLTLLAEHHPHRAIRERGHPGTRLCAHCANRFAIATNGRAVGFESMDAPIRVNLPERIDRCGWCESALTYDDWT